MLLPSDVDSLRAECDLLGEAVSLLYARNAAHVVERTPLFRAWVISLQRSGRALIERDARLDREAMLRGER